MSTQLHTKDAPQVKQSVLTSLRQNIKWQHAIIAVGCAFIIYPRPFLYILNPIIKRIKKSYNKDRAVSRLQKIILTTNKLINSQKICKVGLYNNAENVYIINLLQEQSPKRSSSGLNRSISWDQALDNQPNLYIKADNALLRIKMKIMESKLCDQSGGQSHNYAILIKGSAELLRVVQAKIYEMDCKDYYKIPMFSDEQQFHILQNNNDSQNLNENYEQIIKKIKL